MTNVLPIVNKATARLIAKSYDKSIITLNELGDTDKERETIKIFYDEVIWMAKNNVLFTKQDITFNDSLFIITDGD